MKTEDWYRDIANDVRERFDTSNFNCNRPLPIGVNKKVLRMMKDELGGEIITEFIALRSKMYAYKYITAQNKMITDKRCKGIRNVLYERRYVLMITNQL